MKTFWNGEIEARQAACELSILGYDLPRVIELAMMKEDPNASKGKDYPVYPDEELEALALERKELAERAALGKKEPWLADRIDKVEKLKADVVSGNSKMIS